MKYIQDARNELQELWQQWDQLVLVQEVEEVGKEQEHTSNWVADHLDQRPDVRDEIWQVEQEPKERRRSRRTTSHI